MEPYRSGLKLQTLPFASSIASWSLAVYLMLARNDPGCCEKFTRIRSNRNVEQFTNTLTCTRMMWRYFSVTWISKPKVLTLIGVNKISLLKITVNCWKKMSLWCTERKTHCSKLWQKVLWTSRQRLNTSAVPITTIEQTFHHTVTGSSTRQSNPTCCSKYTTTEQK